MKIDSQSIRSILATIAGITVTVVLALVAEITVIRNGILEPIRMAETIQTIWVLDMLAAFVGGYITARIASHSPVKHAMVAAGILASFVCMDSFFGGISLVATLLQGLAVSTAICLGAVFFDWHNQKPELIQPHVA